METGTPREAPELPAQPAQPQPYIVTTKDLVVLAFAIAGALVAMAIWYNSSYVNPKFTSLSHQVEKLADKLDNFSTVVKDDIQEIDTRTTAIDTTLGGAKEQLDKSETKIDKLTEDLRNEFGKLDTKFASLENTLDTSIKVVERKTESTEKKVEEKLAAIPKTEEVVNQLDQQKEDIEKQQGDIEKQQDNIASINREFDNTGRDITLLKTLLQLGVERPVRQHILQQLALEHPSFKSNPQALITLWKSRPSHSPVKFATKLIEGYGVLQSEAMLLAYDELTEPKPIRFFMKPHEIKANAEPALAAAQAKGRESTVPLAEPITIARVCNEMSRPEIECYNYFLNITQEVGDDVISLDSPSDTAVIKIIIDKHETQIPNT